MGYHQKLIKQKVSQFSLICLLLSASFSEAQTKSFSQKTQSQTTAPEFLKDPHLDWHTGLEESDLDLMFVVEDALLGEEGKNKEGGWFQRSLSKYRKARARLPFLGFGLVRENGYKTTLSPRLRMNYQINPKDRVSVYSTINTYKNEAPFSDQKISTLTVGIGYRHFVNEKLFWDGSCGLIDYRPDPDLRSYFRRANQNLEREQWPYLSLTLGYRIWKNVPLVNRALFGQLSFTETKEYRYPIRDASGHEGFLYPIKFSTTFLKNKKPKSQAQIPQVQMPAATQIPVYPASLYSLRVSSLLYDF